MPNDDDTDTQEDGETSCDCHACMGTGEGYAGRRCWSCRGSGVDRNAVRRAADDGRDWDLDEEVW